MPSLISRFPAKLTPRVDFRASEFRKLIGTHGMPLLWEAAAECPCARGSAGLGLTLDASIGANTGTTAQARRDCPVCSGRGYKYHSSQYIRGVVTGAGFTPDRMRAYGESARGTISLSVLPEHRLNLGDRITIKAETETPSSAVSVQLYRETKVYKGEAATALRYPIVRRALDTVPPQELGVMDLHVAGLDGLALANGARAEGVDFTVVNGEIAWSNPPANGARFSVSYYAHPVYLVTDLPHPFRDTQVLFKRPAPNFTSLPLNATCTLEFMAGPR